MSGAMNVRAMKVVLWASSLGVVASLGAFVVETLQRWPEVQAMLGQDPARQRAALRDDVADVPRTPRRDLVAQERVDAVFTALDWLGWPPPEPEPEPDPGPDAAPPVVAVADLLRVEYLQRDVRRPERSLAYVRFTDPALKGPRAGRASTTKLRVGDRLPAPYGSVRLARVEADVAVFGFDGERADERVPLAELDLGVGALIVVVPEGQRARVPRDAATPVHIAGELEPPPGRTMRVGESHVRIGLVDAAEIARDYPVILTRDVSHRRWRDPRTRRYGGVQVTHVEPGSVAETHGLQAGDVYKSINGTPVTSSAEIIQYVKNHAGTTSVWEVVVERQGLEQVLVFESPVSP